MKLEQIKEALDNDQVGQKPDWKDNTKLVDITDKGINLLKYENLEFEVDGWKFDFIEDFGGEGQGNDFWVVFSVSKDNHFKYYKVPGWYASHHGGELEVENTFEVQPVEKTVTIWEEIQ